MLRSVLVDDHLDLLRLAGALAVSLPRVEPVVERSLDPRKNRSGEEEVHGDDDEENDQEIDHD